MKVWLQSYTPAMPALGPQHPFVSGVCFSWDALYTRNRDSERSMINATIRERRFERRLQTRFDYGYWNVILLLGKVINAPLSYIAYIFSPGDCVLLNVLPCVFEVMPMIGILQFHPGVLWVQICGHVIRVNTPVHGYNLRMCR